MLRKEITTAFMLLLMAFSMMGCKDSETPKATSNPTEQIVVTDTPNSVVYEGIQEDNLMAIYVGEEESQIGLGLDTTTIKEAIGKADEIKKSKGSKTKSDNSKESATQSWYYKDLDTTINFEKSGKVYTVSSIEGGKKATTLKTGGGITVGATKQEVLDAYQDLMTDGKSEKKDQIVIENNGYSQIVFELDGDTVSGIVMELCQ